MNSISKKTIYIHIGHPKTGSSAIQAFLALNHEALKKRGCFYPEPQNFFQVYQTSSGNGNELCNLILSGGFKNEIRSLLDKWLEQGMDVVISSEQFSLILYNEDSRKEFFDTLKGYNFKIVVYLRRFDDFIQSQYNQIVKNHDFTGHIENYILSGKIRDFAQMILEIAKKIHKSQLIVRPYEKQQFKDNNIYSDFLETIGLGFSDEFILPGKIVNPSLNPKALEFRRMANITGKDKHIIPTKTKLNGVLAEYTVENGGGSAFEDGSYLNGEQRQKLLEPCMDKYKKIAKKLLNRKNGILFYNDIPAGSKESALPGIQGTVELAEYILRKSHIPGDYNEMISQFVVNGVMDTIIDNKIEEVNEFSNITGSKIYSLVEEPIHHSKDIETLSFADGRLSIKSIGSDPWFELPGLSMDTGNIYVTMEIDYPMDSILQVFYRFEESNYSEEFQITKFVDAGISKHIFAIKAKQKITGIRIDPSNRKGIYKILSLEIYS
ncbi:MAG: hypothetical protein JXN10_08440 [Clostridia bacterium]|nr:hypothetical protein [Clostridia bacterium]